MASAGVVGRTDSPPSRTAGTGRYKKNTTYFFACWFLILIFSLAIVNIWRGEVIVASLRGGGDIPISNDKEEEVHNKKITNKAVGRVRNPNNISDTSPTCTEEQRSSIARQLMLIEDKDIRNTDSETIHSFPRLKSWFSCPNTTWIEQHIKNNIGTSDFLGISVGCNKGHDAIRTARMGLSDPTIDPLKWKDEFHSEYRSVCSQDNAPVSDVNPMSPRRNGEMHCIEPMPATFTELERAAEKLGLKSKGMVFTQAAISSATGTVLFPNGRIGTEWSGMDLCNSNNGKVKSNCVEVPRFSLEDYVAKYVKGTGPINILQIDVEGYDFDVLFGAGAVLDSTHYLEFEYNKRANWMDLHLQDTVRLLDGKGFTCYWAGDNRLWRISGCYFEHYNHFTDWSNVACVHRSQEILYGRMEKMFTDLLKEEL